MMSGFWRFQFLSFIHFWRGFVQMTVAAPSTSHLLQLQVEPPKEPTKEDIDRMAKEMGMS